MRPKRVRPSKTAGERPPPQAGRRPLMPEDFDGLLEKLKLLEFGLFGLQQLGGNSALEAEDIGPFTRLAEEIESDVLDLQQRCPRRTSAASGG